MSESRAKKARKEQVPQVEVKKKNKGGTIFNIVVVLVIAAVLGAGIWASYDKIKANMPEETQDAQTTIADVAQEEGLSAEELLTKLGLQDSGLTAETPSDDLFAVMTIENYAKYEDTDVAEFKVKYGIESLADNTLWSEAQMQIPMSKVAENQYGMSFEEFAAQAGLPAEITGDMTQQEAMEVIEAQSGQAE